MTKEEEEYLSKFSDIDTNNDDMTVSHAKRLLSNQKCKNCFYMIEYKSKLYCSFDIIVRTPYYAEKLCKEVTANYTCMLWVEK